MSIFGRAAKFCSYCGAPVVRVSGYVRSGANFDEETGAAFRLVQPMTACSAWWATIPKGERVSSRWNGHHQQDAGKPTREYTA